MSSEVKYTEGPTTPEFVEAMRSLAEDFSGFLELIGNPEKAVFSFRYKDSRMVASLTYIESEDGTGYDCTADLKKGPL